MKFKEKLQNKKFVITSEIGPPKGTNLEKMKKDIELLKKRVDGLNVTDNQSSVMRLSSLGGCILIKQLTHGDKEEVAEPILQLTCRDRNRLALQSELLSAYAHNIDNVLCLTGDHVMLGDHPGAKQVFDVDSVQLLRIVERLNQGYDIGGNELDGGTNFCQGAVINVQQSLSWQVLKFRKKCEAGALFFQTQAIFDIDKFKEFLDKLPSNLLDRKILAGILVLTSIGMIKYINRNVAGITVPEGIIKQFEGLSKQDQLKKGIEIAIDLISRIKKERLCSGVHIMAIGQEHLVAEILDQL